MNFEFFSRFRRATDRLLTGSDWTPSDPFAPPPGVETEMGRLLWSAPTPLIHPAARMLVIFSAKSACTNVLIWFLHHLGHAEVARQFHNWPHEYRERVYYYSELYRKAYKLNFNQFKVVRVVRDPYDRAASSFRHVLRIPFADRDIARASGHRDMPDKGLSFAQFLDFLENSDLVRCDMHYALQRHPIEDKLKPHYLINVSKEDLFKRLNGIEADLGLEQTDLQSMAWVQRLRRHNRPKAKLASSSDLYTRPLTREQATVGPWPDSSALLTPEARARIAKLYAVDIEAYAA
jgi:hypothetical protein